MLILSTGPDRLGDTKMFLKEFQGIQKNFLENFIVLGAIFSQMDVWD